MKQKSARSNFTIFLSGTLLLVLAVLLFIHPFQYTSTNYRLISIVFVLSGLLNILAFAQNHRWYFRPGWMLQQSFFLIFFGIMLFLADYIELDTDLLLFSFMAFFTAAAQLACCIQLHALEIRRWWWIAIFSVVNILFGVYILVNPLSVYVDDLISVAIYVCITGLMGILEPLVYIRGTKREERVS